MCPLTLALMQDPVVTPEGHSFERSAIETWLQQNSVSPITRTPLTSEMLAPNFSLRSAIEEWRAANPTAPATSAATPKPVLAGAAASAAAAANFAPSQLALELSAAPAENEPGVTNVMMAVVPPAGTTRTPVDVCCVVDISGSMDEEAKLKGANGATESHGLSVLDVVKHAVRTVIESLDAQDNLSIVAYDDKAETVLQLTPMTAAGKKLAHERLATLAPDGSTNLWDGLHAGLENLRQASSKDRVSSVFLLTDGQPNVVPPRGHIPMLQKYKDSNKDLHCSINTFGFGYNLDSELLKDLAIHGDGAYAFIPDSGFVGTIFVHALANLLTTAAHNVQLSVQAPDGVELLPALGAVQSTKASWGQTITLGSVNHGQPRHVIVPVRGAAQGQLLQATLKYVPAGSTETQQVEAQIDASQVQTAAGAAQGLIDAQAARLDATATMVRIMSLFQQHDEPSARQQLDELRGRLRASRSVNQPSVLTLLEDLDGQVYEAISKMEYFRRWGRHFLPSLQRAHLLQACNNFKDPGVQAYGGDLFRATRDTVDALFCKLPPPKASKKLRAGAAPVASMARYSNRSNPCFHGDSLVLMADGSLVRVAAVGKGALVCGPNGQAARVLCVVKTHCAGGRTSLVTLSGGLLVTPYHPVRVGGVWQFPLALAAATEQECDAVYSFVLASGHTMLINGTECCTLGHGFTDNAVITHAYLGTERVVQDLQRMPGWDAGLVEFLPGCLARDRSSTLAAGFNPQRLVVAAC